MDRRKFTLVGPRPAPPPPSQGTRPTLRGKPVMAVLFLTLLLLGCLVFGALLPEPGRMDSAAANLPPAPGRPFGSDPLGRDLFSMIWAGGRASLLIGAVAGASSTLLAVVYGTASALAPRAVDQALSRLLEITLSVPSILLLLFLQGILGASTPITLALVIGCASFMGMAKMVRGEARRLLQEGYVQAARLSGAGFFYLLRVHLAPGFLSALLYMAVTQVGAAIAMESTLSFLGLGLPLETLSLGSILSQAQRALLTGSWWLILIPGLFLALTLACLNEIGTYLHAKQVAGDRYI